MKKTINLTMMLFTLLAVTNFCFAQDKAEIEKTIKYLESTIEYRNSLMVSSTAQKVLASDVIESSLSFNTDTGGKSRSIIQDQYFLKSGDILTSYKVLNDMLSSSEFIESIKAKNFKLITEEDVLAFQSMLRLIDKKRGLGFFKENDIWYFIRSKFFDDIEAYVVTIDQEGQITSVVYERNLRKEVPKKLQKFESTQMAQAAEMASLRISGKINQDMTLEKKTVSKKDSAYMHNYLLDDLNYVFEISPHSLNSVNKISTLSIFKCALKITDEVAILRDPFLLVLNNNEYTKYSSGDKVLKMPLFLKSLLKKYKIEKKEDARLFQDLLDDLALFSRDFDNDIKTFYKKENMWIFVRKKDSNGLKGYLLKVDEKHRVSYIEYNAISDENITEDK